MPMLLFLSNAARFLVPLALALTLLAVLAVPVAESMMSRWLASDLDERAELVRDALEAQVVASIRRGLAGEAGARGERPTASEVTTRPGPDTDASLSGVAAASALVAAFDRALRDEQLHGLVLCAPDGSLLAATERAQVRERCAEWVAIADAPGRRLERDGGRTYLRALSVSADPSSPPLGVLVVQHHFAFSDNRLSAARWSLIGLFALMAAVAATVTLFVARLTWRGWLESARVFLRTRKGGKLAIPATPALQPLAKDLQSLIDTLEQERSQRPFGDGQWTPRGLRDLLEQQFPGDEVIVVSNREPYIHARRGEDVVVQRPASGLVSAVEPVMRACSGTWIAHGSGGADRDVVDAYDCVTVPPGLQSDASVYQLRRIWLTPEEEQGFYYGFSNEGLWPLCHVAHVRPIFRDEDWEHYKEVNRRFADAVAAQARTDDPIVLIQDYHFALAPAMVRERLPDATIITFWHIPWPNFESFGICPWKEELLQGLLGSDILGFHTPYHCRNFLETVDRFLEVRIEHESDTVSMAGSLTHVHPYPISIAWPQPLSPEAFPALRERVRARYGLDAAHRLAIGVDRLDYTKGIVERVRAVDRLFERYPQWLGQFTLVQIAAPSRSALPEYRRFEADVLAVVEQVNRRHGNEHWQPVRLLLEHHDSDDVTEHYRAADVALVTSLHDGMNLVSKEFVAAHDDERGTLIVSQFAGAARELLDALVVNPYHSDEVAQALHYALSMPEAEQQLRMRSMRQLVKSFNVYRWAGRMLMDAGRLRRRVRLEQRIRQGRVRGTAPRVAGTPPKSPVAPPAPGSGTGASSRQAVAPIARPADATALASTTAASSRGLA
ncbi:MAG: trehalose-6-phosphate synthase [Lautropia sp.]